MPILISIAIIIFSHLTVDKDFDETTKLWAYIVFAIIAIWYIVTRVVF